MLQDSSSVLVTVVSLYLDLRTKQAAPFFLLVQQTGKEYVGENEKVGADPTFTCSQNSDQLAQSFKSTNKHSRQNENTSTVPQNAEEAKARAVFISPHLYPLAGH